MVIICKSFISIRWPTTQWWMVTAVLVTMLMKNHFGKCENNAEVNFSSDLKTTEYPTSDSSTLFPTTMTPEPETNHQHLHTIDNLRDQKRLVEIQLQEANASTLIARIWAVCFGLVALAIGIMVCIKGGYAWLKIKCQSCSRGFLNRWRNGRANSRRPNEDTNTSGLQVMHTKSPTRVRSNEEQQVQYQEEELRQQPTEQQPLEPQQAGQQAPEPQELQHQQQKQDQVAPSKIEPTQGEQSGLRLALQKDQSKESQLNKSPDLQYHIAFSESSSSGGLTESTIDEEEKHRGQNHPDRKKLLSERTEAIGIDSEVTFKNGADTKDSVKNKSSDDV